MRFKLDENLPLAACRLLRESGFDAMSVWDQEMIGASDQELARICSAEDRVLMTFDLDFANIRSYPPSQFAGFVVFRLLTQDKRHLLSILKKTVPIFAKNSPERQLWIVEEDRIRIRE